MRLRPVADRVLRQALQVQVERRVDVGRRAAHVDGPAGQLLLDEVDEVGRLGLEGAGRGEQRLLAGALGFRRVRDAVLHHHVQHDVAALGAALGRAERRQRLRRLDHAGQRRRFGQRQVQHVLAEVEPGRLRQAVHRERSAVAEIHLVQIQLEDLILRQAALGDDRHELFLELPRVGLLGREQQVLDQLLRQRAAAHQVAPSRRAGWSSPRPPSRSGRRRGGRRSGDPRWPARRRARAWGSAPAAPCGASRGRR